MSLSPREATLPSPTHPSHTLCCHRAAPDSLHCLPRPLSSHTFSPRPHSHCPHSQATPTSPPAVIAVLDSLKVPANPPALWACSLSPPALCQLLSYLIRLPLPRVERPSAISNRQRELPQKSSMRGADGRSRPREAKACPRLGLLGVSNIPHRTPRPLLSALPSNTGTSASKRPGTTVKCHKWSCVCRLEMVEPVCERVGE